MECVCLNNIDNFPLEVIEFLNRQDDFYWLVSTEELLLKIKINSKTKQNLHYCFSKPLIKELKNKSLYSFCMKNKIKGFDQIIKLIPHFDNEFFKIFKSKIYIVSIDFKQINYGSQNSEFCFSEAIKAFWEEESAFQYIDICKKQNRCANKMNILGHGSEHCENVDWGYAVHKCLLSSTEKIPVYDQDGTRYTDVYRMYKDEFYQDFFKKEFEYNVNEVNRCTANQIRTNDQDYQDDLKEELKTNQFML